MSARRPLGSTGGRFRYRSMSTSAVRRRPQFGDGLAVAGDGGLFTSADAIDDHSPPWLRKSRIVASL